jgi:cytidyltransferase-like protein
MTQTMTSAFAHLGLRLHFRPGGEFHGRDNNLGPLEANRIRAVPSGAPDSRSGSVLLPEDRTLKQPRLIGVYWGRFNPPHKGHLATVRRLKRGYHLTVAIGSSEHKNERRDPFSGAERKAMFRAYLREAGIRGVAVVALNDGKSMAWSVSNLIRKCKPDVLFLSDEKSDLVTIAARMVHVVRFPRTGRVSSTRIRDLIARDDPSWKNLTGRSVTRAVERLGGIRRIQRAYTKTGPEPWPRPA